MEEKEIARKIVLLQRIEGMKQRGAKVDKYLTIHDPIEEIELQAARLNYIYNAKQGDEFLMGLVAGMLGRAVRKIVHELPAQNQDSCAICMDSLPTIVFLPCKHLAVCLNCNAKLSKRVCPICTQNIESQIITYRNK